MNAIFRNYFFNEKLDEELNKLYEWFKQTLKGIQHNKQVEIWTNGQAKNKFKADDFFKNPIVHSI